MSSVLADIPIPTGWDRRPFGRLVRRSKASGRPDLPPLSVFLHDGVVPRSSRDDNHNRLGEDVSKYLVVRPGDVVFNKLRTWQGGLGVSRYEGIVSPAYYVCRPQPSMEPRFLHYLLRSQPYLAELTRVSKFMPPSQFDILWDDLREVPVVHPSLAEQRVIADFLDTETARIDALIAKKQELRAQLLERRKALTYVAVAGGPGCGATLKPSEIPWLPSIPEHWREAPLTLVARLGSGHTPSREREEWWTDCRIPWVTTGEVAQMRSDRIEFVSETRESISELGLANSAAELHRAGTVVLSRTASAGFSAIMGRDMATSQDFVTWTCGPLLEPRFLLLCLRAMRSDLLDRLAQGSTHKTIYMPDIRSIRIPLPPTEEQLAIVERTWDELRKVDGTVERLEEQVGLLREHSQALITSAVTGELEVRGVAS